MDGVRNSEATSKTRLSRSEINSIKRQEKNEEFFKNNEDKMTYSIPSQKADHVGSSQNKKSYASSLNGDRDSKVKKQVTAVKGNTLSNVPLTPSLITSALVLDDSCADNILEKFKVIFKGNVYTARAKELFTWTPIFLDHKESEYISNDESLHGAKNKSVGSQHEEDDLVDDNDVEGVSETFLENDHRGVDLNTETDKVNSPLVHTKRLDFRSVGRYDSGRAIYGLRYGRVYEGH
uniref:RNA-directed DNA polymerase, eukaryota n=1 Tax=Tanacetum cinerariifolium TaxID=118510 RepID=A0A699IB68_TANCI|nr:RNA-directed DNA polymerase, eukaryota [Tanacetum cinerariifolium]